MLVVGLKEGGWYLVGKKGGHEALLRVKVEGVMLAHEAHARERQGGQKTTPFCQLAPPTVKELMPTLQ